MAYSNYPNGFANGVTIRGLPINVSYPGKMWFLNNSGTVTPGGIGGSDLNPGTYQKPFATLAHALAKCVTNRGDIIAVMPGHAETFSSATALTINVSDVLIIGMGAGASRPTFTLNTATTATINITAPQVGFCNCLFVANFAAIVSCFTLTTAKDFSLSNCEFRDTSSILNFVSIITSDAVSDDTDGLYIDTCNWFGLGATTNSCFATIAGTNDRPTIKNCYMTSAAVSNTAYVMTVSGTKIITNAIIQNNVFNFKGATSATAGIVISTGATTNTGVLNNNYVHSLDDTTPILVTASSGFVYYNNYYSATADTSGFLLPAVGS